MSSKKGQSKADQDPLPVSRTQDELPERAIARTILRPSVQAGLTLRRTAPNADDTTLKELIEELSELCADASKGNLGRGEAMLMTQAHVLDSIFNRLIRRAAANEGQYLEAAERYYRLALRAQSQCRGTIESLALIKNPPASVAFVRQANIAHGPQQVNNAPPDAASRARESANPPNKLLEQADGERLDVRATAATSGTDSELEAVEAIDGTTNGCGQETDFS